jgi:hypothetical protein
VKKAVRLKRTLEECLQNERQKIAELYVGYMPYWDMSGVKFLRGEYFRDNDRFIRFQEVPEEYLTRSSRGYHFISQRWLSLEHSDLAAEGKPTANHKPFGRRLHRRVPTARVQHGID